MNWDAIGAVGEIIGAAAVVATLFYLALEMKRSRVASEAQGTVSSNQFHSRWRIALMENATLSAALAKANIGEALAETEKVQLYAFADELFTASAVSYANTMSSGSVHDVEGEYEYLASVLRENPGLLPHWERLRTIIALVSSDFANQIDEITTQILNGEPD